MTRGGWAPRAVKQAARSRRLVSAIGGPSASPSGICVTRKPKFLALTTKERNCVVWVFLLAVGVLPGLVGAWRFSATRVEPSTSFAVILGLRLLIPLAVGGLCVSMLWKRRATLTASVFGVGVLWASLWFGFVASFILITGRVPSKYHSYSVPREEAIPYFAVALLALAVGAAVVFVGRRLRARGA